ncbi:hypothetical protein Tco_0928917 [Tanacetum coccineum]
MVREHIGLKILSWKKVDSESIETSSILAHYYILKLNDFVVAGEIAVAKWRVPSLLSSIYNGYDVDTHCEREIDDEIRSVGAKLVRKREVMQEEWEVELHTRGILILLEAARSMKGICYFNVNLIMRDRERQEKNYYPEFVQQMYEQRDGYHTERTQLAAQWGQV